MARLAATVTPTTIWVARSTAPTRIPASVTLVEEAAVWARLDKMLHRIMPTSGTTTTRTHAPAAWIVEGGATFWAVLDGTSMLCESKRVMVCPLICCSSQPRARLSPRHPPEVSASPPWVSSLCRVNERRA